MAIKKVYNRNKLRQHDMNLRDQTLGSLLGDNREFDDYIDYLDYLDLLFQEETEDYFNNQ